ncbi:MAG TPA: tetratricopeptide repeat protein [Planctomycetota bacterium]|jgi:tetratricopeptide (TPR) repeat protein|nr:tetratricopeptide repeat protein [Planctomycetota bacterium]
MKLLLLALGALGFPQESAPSRPASGPESRPAPPLETLLRRALETYAAEDFPAAESALKEALPLAPENPEIHRRLATLYLRVRRFGDSARCFERYLALEPSAVGGCPWIGNAYHEIGDFEKAEAWYRRVLGAAPGNLEAKRGLALTLHKKGDDARAEPLFREVAASAKFGSVALAAARRYLGEILLARGDGRGAILELQQAKAEDPFSAEVAYALARAFAAAGESARAEEERARHRLLNEHSQEIEALRAHLRARPGDLEAMAKIAGHLSAIGDHAGAERTLRRAVALSPNDPSPRLGLVDFLEARARPEEARRALEEAALLFPEAPSVFERAFRFHRARGDFQAMYEAAEAFHRLTGKAPR